MLPVPAIYRDADLLVVDKPAGMASQATRRGEPGLVEHLAAAGERVRLHHRLDRPASGLLVLARSRRANPGLARAFRAHRVARTYLAVVVGDPGASGRWAMPLDGRPAATRWERVGRGGGMAVLRVGLETGRTHQVRRHAAAAGHPLVGDRRYGGAAASLWPRLALHAWRLALPHPVTGARLALESPPPEDLVALLREAGWRG